jgi:lysophospholipase L1-like esterase
MKRRTIPAILVLLVGGWLLTAHDQADERDPTRWEKAIAAFEASDRQQAPPTSGLLFVGSSSIRGWDLSKYFPDLATINRGFGGSHAADVVYYADRVILPYKPRVIVVYAGENDINSGKTPQQVHADYLSLVAEVHHALPSTKVVYIAIKPSIARWALVGKMRETNRRIRQTTEQDERLEFIDIDTPMIGADGEPRRELFADDGLHLSRRGYQLWTKLVRAHLTNESAGSAGK